MLHPNILSAYKSNAHLATSDQDVAILFNSDNSSKEN